MVSYLSTWAKLVQISVGDLKLNQQVSLLAKTRMNGVLDSEEFKGALLSLLLSYDNCRRVLRVTVVAWNLPLMKYNR